MTTCFPVLLCSGTGLSTLAKLNVSLQALNHYCKNKDITKMKTSELRSVLQQRFGAEARTDGFEKSISQLFALWRETFSLKEYEDLVR